MDHKYEFSTEEIENITLLLKVEILGD